MTLIKRWFSGFFWGFRLVARDSMLVLLMAAPFLAGLLFRFGIPAIDRWIAAQWTGKPLLMPYAAVFDLMLLFLTPYLLCTAASLIMLEERDHQVGAYFRVTPMGLRGYLTARLVIPAFGAVLISILLLMLFSLTNLSLLAGFGLALLAAFSAIAAAMVVVAAANNKVEGMALMKLTGISMVGLLVPWFIESNAQYAFAIFPSYWMARALLETQVTTYTFFILTGVACSLLWIVAFYRVFTRKIV